MAKIKGNVTVGGREVFTFATDIPDEQAVAVRNGKARLDVVVVTTPKTVEHESTD